MKKTAARRRLPLWAAVALDVVFAVGITLLVWALEPEGLAPVLAVVREAPLVALLNGVPIFLLLLAATFLFASPFTAAALVGLLWAGLSLANTIKIEIRDDPLSFQDIFLVREGMEAATSYHIDWPWALIAALVLGVVLLGLCGWFLRAQMPKRRWARLALVVLPLALLAGMVQTVIADRHFYDNLPVSNEAYMPAIYCERGYIYSFFHYITTYQVAAPEGYDKEEAAAWDSAPAEDAEGAPVNVVFIQNEAFSDISEWSGFAYDEENDPLKNFHALEKDAHALSGHIVVPQFAGGTANTEFDVLTGMQTVRAASSAFRSVHHDVGSLFRVFDGAGYETSMMHPGDAWFYNRENVYRWLGCEESAFIDALNTLPTAGGWVLDAGLAERLVEEINEKTADGALFFNETVTIQNHMSYTADKYGGEAAIPEVPLSVEVDDATREMLSVYMKGVRDADAMLGTLTDAYRESDTPIVFVFYGDHLPYLGDGQAGYKALGKNFTPDDDAPMTAEALEAYETPYLIWANDAAAAALDWSATTEQMALPETMSACYLGASVLELVGREGADPWYDYLCEMRRTLPVLTQDAAMRADGTLVALEDLHGEEQAAFEKMANWAYYRLVDAKIE